MSAYIIDAIRTPIGRFGGVFSGIRSDGLGAIPLRELQARNPELDWSLVDDVIYGCVNQAGEGNRNVARMSGLLSGLPASVPGTTVNRLCGSGMDAINIAARAVKSGEADLLLAGGIEPMSRAPFVMNKADKAFSRQMQMEDTTIGWRFINPLMKNKYGTDSMRQTADNVAQDYNISREDQDNFALNSQKCYASAYDADFFSSEIIPVRMPKSKGDPVTICHDEHPRRDITIEKLARLKPVNGVGAMNNVTAGNSSSVNDGACAVLLSSEQTLNQHRLTARGRVVVTALAGVEPHLMGMGPVPASRRALKKANFSLKNMDMIELNEAFAAQSLVPCFI